MAPVPDSSPLVVIPTSLVLIPTSLVVIPTSLVVIPTFLVVILTFLVVILTLSLPKGKNPLLYQAATSLRRFAFLVVILSAAKNPLLYPDSSTPPQTRVPHPLRQLHRRKGWGRAATTASVIPTFITPQAGEAA